MGRTGTHCASAGMFLVGVIHACVAGRAAAAGALDLLQQHCIVCHSPKVQKGGLDLSTREALLAGGDEGPAVEPGQPENSLLFRLIRHEQEPHMPRKAAKLSDADIAVVGEWIRGGAPYDRVLKPADHRDEAWWSLRPLVKPAPPKVSDASWIKTPIDRFVLAQLEGKGMAPSPPAERPALLRRVTFDLTGLPPTPQEVETFVADVSLEAFAKVVDRLLASPRYGERWARHWLDVVHYADTHGHDQDRPRPNAWPYRDYVIVAFNSDKPYARFVEEQIAGDILYPEDPQATVALGFIAAGPWDESSQIHIMGDTLDKKIAQSLDRDDMVTTTMATFMSTTANCARCHSHKFDPIPQADYYALQACFAGVDRAERPFDTDPKVHAMRQSLLRRKGAIETKQPALLASLGDADTRAQLAAWEQEAGKGVAAWTTLDPVLAISENGCTLKVANDGSVLSSGDRPERDTYTIVAHAPLTGITAVRLEVLVDPSLPYKGPGRQDNGNLHLSKVEVYASSLSDPADLRPVSLQGPTADFNQRDWTIAHALDGDTRTAWGIHPAVGKPHTAVFQTRDRVGWEGGTLLTFVLRQLHGGGHLIGKLRLSVTTAPQPVLASGLPDRIAAILAVSTDERTEPQRVELGLYYLGEQIGRQLAALPAPQVVYAAAYDFAPQNNFVPAKLPRPIHLLKRGDITQEGELALPGALSCIPGLPQRFELSELSDEGARRSALAKWITDSRNALTWRSIVNRIWQYHVGRGLVDTPNDFGRMGSQPTHPELLDWLAVTFLDSGGSFKQLHRLILTSAVYQQSSAHRFACAEVDGDNHALWRMNRARLDAESIRDAILHITGKLDLTMGGPSVKQFHFEDPDPGRTPMVDYDRFDVDSPGNNRRSIYRYLFRTLPDPFMDSMDCPDGSQLTPKRNASVTALQALAMLNDRFVVRQSEHFATRLAAISTDLDTQLDGAYRLALCRSPRPDETELLRGYAEKHGLANLCRMLLNSNEFMFVE